MLMVFQNEISFNISSLNEEYRPQQAEQIINIFINTMSVSFILWNEKWIWETCLKKNTFQYTFVMLFIDNASSLLFYFAGWMLVLSLALRFVHMHVVIILVHVSHIVTHCDFYAEWIFWFTL